MQVPTTFNEMFLFNAAVMGFADSSWMTLILDQFHNIVTNVANSYRLQEECDVLTLVLDKHEGQVHLSEFKATYQTMKIVVPLPPGLCLTLPRSVQGSYAVIFALPGPKRMGFRT